MITEILFVALLVVISYNAGILTCLKYLEHISEKK